MSILALWQISAKNFDATTPHPPFRHLLPMPGEKGKGGGAFRELIVRTGLLLCMALAMHAGFAQIYKWTDSQGVVHFSDKPSPGAEKINLSQPSTYPPRPSASSASKDEKTVESKQQEYSSLKILQPKQQATIRNNRGHVMVISQLEPELKSGDKLQIVFDGTPLSEPKPTTVFTLNDIPRGSHTLAVQVVDSQGNVLTTSEPITIYMQQPRVKSRP